MRGDPEKAAAWYAQAAALGEPDAAVRLARMKASRKP
jgi:TPR repeat protein